MMNWKDGPVQGCIITPLSKYEDDRGWLAEIFRTDELEPSLLPLMTYISQTDAGKTRGPHEHREQTDLFAFYSGDIRLFLWDNRSGSATYGNRKVLSVGESNQVIVVIPPGVAHAYRNNGNTAALIVNCPNRLYAGPGKSEPVDEIRHEDQTDSPFQLD